MSIDYDKLSDDDKSLITNFLRTADRLRQSDLFRDGLFALSFNMKWDAKSGVLRQHCDRPPEKDVRDALLDVRKFVAKSERIFFYKVCNCIYLLLSDETAREHLASVRQGFKNSLAGLNGASSVKIGLAIEGQADPKHIQPEDIIDLYFNGEYFHTDAKKAPHLGDLKARIGLMLEYSFLEAIRNIADCIFYLTALIRREFQLPQELQD